MKTANGRTIGADNGRFTGKNQGVRQPLIIGHYGGCNTGDEAMLAALLGAVSPNLRSHAAIVLKNGCRDSLPSHYGATPIPAGLRPVLRALIRSDGLVLGGGTHFHDDYTTRRYLRHLRYMLRIVGLSMLAKILGRRVIWLGMGFGPFYRRPTRWVTRLGLKFCDRVTVRDAESQREVSAWIDPDKLSLAFDLAALLSDDLGQRVSPSRADGHSSTTLGVSVTSCSQSMTSGPSVDAVIWRRLASVLNRTLCDRPNMRVKVVVLRGGDREADWALSEEFHDAIAASHPGRTELVPYTPELPQIMSTIAGCDAFVATRYHAGMLAYMAGCNLMFIAYHRKVCDLAREIGLSEPACVMPWEKLSEEDLRKRINHLMEGKEPYRARLPVEEAARRAWLNIESLEEVSSELSCRKLKGLATKA